MSLQLKPVGMLTSWKTGLKIEHLWTLLPFVFLIVVTFGTPLRLLDFWWHLKMGEVIVTSFDLPETDIFSFTSGEKPFLLQSWLAEVALYLLYLVGGLRLIVAGNVAVLTLALLAVYASCRRHLAAPRLCALISVPLIVPLVIYSNVRPQTFSILLFAVFFGLLNEYRWGNRDRLWFLPALMLIWANLHGGFPLGLGLIGIFWLDTLAAALRESERRGREEFKRLTLVGVVAALATLVNPAVIGLHLDVLGVLRDPPSQRFVSEWQAPLINDWTGGLGFFFPFVATTAVFILSRGVRRVDFILYLVFSLFAFTALRNAIWFAIVAPPIVARQLAALPRFAQGRVNGTRVASGHPGFNLIFLLLMICVVIGSSPWVYPTLKQKPLWEPSTPAQAVDFIESESLEGNFFHPQIFGDFFIWRLWPSHRSFIDGRVHLFDGDFVRDYFAVFDDPAWELRLRPYDIRYLFLSRKDPGDRGLYDRATSSPEWELLYDDGIAAVFEHIEAGD